MAVILCPSLLEGAGELATGKRRLWLQLTQSAQVGLPAAQLKCTTEQKLSHGASLSAGSIAALLHSSWHFRVPSRGCVGATPEEVHSRVFPSIPFFVFSTDSLRSSP